MRRQWLRAILTAHPPSPLPERAHAEPMSRMVAEIRKPAADRLEITQDELIKRADKIFKLAMTAGQLGAALNALKELGPAQPVTRPSRSSASGSIDNSPNGIFLH
jgi:hypothetical protein